MQLLQMSDISMSCLAMLCFPAAVGQADRQDVAAAMAVRSTAAVDTAGDAGAAASADK